MFKLRSKPFASHQEEAIAWLSSRGSGAILLPMGTGKTYITLAYLSLQSGRAIVVAPLTVLRSWKKQIHEHTTASVGVATGSAGDRVSVLDSDVDIVLINYDFFSRIQKSQERYFDRFRSVVLDESTRIKNPRAKRTANIIRVFQKTERKILLTGNPMPRGYEDLFSQWLFMDGGQSLGRNYFHFLRRHFNPIDFGSGQRGWTISAKGPSTIAAQISGTYFFRKKEDCVDLPPKVFERRYYNLRPAAHKHYAQLLKEWLTEVGGVEKVTNNALSRDIALRQICSGFLMVGDQIQRLESEKYDLLLEVLEEIGDDEQAVVWFWFREEGARLLETIRSREPSVDIIHGGVDREARDEVLKRFEERHLRIVLAQQQTCAYGINEFAKCRFSIYFGHTYDYDLRSQSEDRTSRIGSTHSCTYIDLVAEKSIEEAILQVLDKKQRMSESMFKDEIKLILQGWR